MPLILKSVIAALTSLVIQKLMMYVYAGVFLCGHDTAIFLELLLVLGFPPFWAFERKFPESD